MYTLVNVYIRLYPYKMDKLCLSCGKTIIGRADKKFCSSYCRSAYHYEQKGQQTNLVRRVNYILKKNRDIISKLNPKGKTRVSKTTLITKGFNFNYFTNIYRTKNEHEYRFCYDQGYIEWEDGSCTLVVKQEYVE